MVSGHDPLRSSGPPLAGRPAVHRPARSLWRVWHARHAPARPAHGTTRPLAGQRRRQRLWPGTCHRWPTASRGAASGPAQLPWPASPGRTHRQPQPGAASRRHLHRHRLSRPGGGGAHHGARQPRVCRPARAGRVHLVAQPVQHPGAAGRAHAQHHGRRAAAHLPARPAPQQPVGARQHPLARHGRRRLEPLDICRRRGRGGARHDPVCGPARQPSSRQPARTPHASARGRHRRL